MSKGENVTVKLPSAGDVVPASKFFVSEMNVRVAESFGDKPEDVALTQHLLFRELSQPFIARPEGNGYGVIVGRRRFLAKLEAKFKTFTVGKDCLIREMSDEEALAASLRENLKVFRSNMNPVTRAKALSKLLDTKMVGLRSLARSERLAASTLSDWLRMLELSEKMQDVTAKGLVGYTDALKVARLKLGEERQDLLAEAAEESNEVFKRELARLQAGKGKRGIPKGKYIICRTVFDRMYPPDVKTYERLVELAEEKGQQVDEYTKEVLTKHVETVG